LISSNDRELKIISSKDLQDLACVIVGTRPGIIKQSPLIHLFQTEGIPFFVIHTGQHYSPEMDANFFQDLDLPQPNFRVAGVSECTSHAQQTSAMLTGVESHLA